jgi:hypothetical protein
MNNTLLAPINGQMLQADGKQILRVKTEREISNASTKQQSIYYLLDQGVGGLLQLCQKNAKSGTTVEFSLPNYSINNVLEEGHTADDCG